MKTKTINYDPLVTIYNGQKFNHGELVYTQTIGHDDSTNISANFGLAALNDSVDNFKEELMTLLEKYAQ